ncbi:MAG TPA: hypothetical protein VIF43_00660 [Patescibacteria group bacterium]|jgi:hypothetical protein
MNEQYRKADEHFGEEVLSDSERTHRRDVQKDARRKRTLKDGAKRAAKIAGIGIPTAAIGTAIGAEVLQSMDGKPLGSFAGTEKTARPFPKPPQSERDRQMGEAIARAQASVEAGEPAPQSGTVDVSEAGVTGYVDFSGGDPEDVTTVDGSQMGGLPAEQDPDTGGLPSDSTS